MARKKKVEETECPVPIDYRKLVDDMSDQAFEFCADQLYPLCNYRVLQREDIRRVDLKEWLLEINTMVPKGAEDKETGALNYYLSILKLYFVKFIMYGSEPRAKKYQDRAMELMEAAVSEEGTIEDIEDVVQIFISIFRSAKEYHDKHKRYYVSSITFNVFKEDAVLLKEIWDNKKLVPDESGVKPPLVGKLFKPGNEKSIAAKLAYINNVIFLCRCLQNRGVFAMEDE